MNKSHLIDWINSTSSYQTEPNDDENTEWITVLCGFGIIGNVIGIIILYSKDLRKKTINIYLRVLVLSDILFLLNFIISVNFVNE
jgi:hypothetical protein